MLDLAARDLFLALQRELSAVVLELFLERVRLLLPRWLRVFVF